MGLKLFGNSSLNPNPIPPEPNPDQWEILECAKVGNYYIVVARYYGCTTYGGKKLLLCNSKPQGQRLDPHLLNDNHIVEARFKPNKQGVRLARLCALTLTENEKE